ncbi:MAG: type I secretion system permease/ATPase [Halocynthiibacter sp.]
MRSADLSGGLAELRAARRDSRKLFWAVALFSAFVNLLMLTGPLFMLQVYDRVLGSRSVETLLALSVLVAFLFGMMGLLDYARGRILSRIGARFQARLDQRVFSAVLRAPLLARGQAAARTGLQDLEAVQRFIASPVLSAFFDLPWTPIFLTGILIFHPWLGILAISGGVVLVLVTFLNQWATRAPVLAAHQAGRTADFISAQIRAEAETVQSIGMQTSAFERWQIARSEALVKTMETGDSTGIYSSLTKTLRLFLQSAMLGLGAYLVLRDELTPGAMIAGSILLGRALAPVELAIGQWTLVQRASKGWSTLAELLSSVPAEVSRTALPTPRAQLDVTQLTVIPPGESIAALRMVSFTLRPGQAIGIIGPSGAGKSTLARALTGVWRPAGGSIRLDGATLEQYAPDALGTHIGYLPQRVELFDGTIAENIAHLQLNPDAETVVTAAKRADAHEMIVKLPDGYDTRVTAAGGRLSGGQIQRIGLARALFGNPVILVLDEPNSNLDNDGSEALNLAIRKMKADGRSVLIMAHRPAAIQECETLLVLDHGARRAFGPKDEVLRSMVQNFQDIQNAAEPGSVT